MELKEYDMEVLVHLNDEALLVMLPLLSRTSARASNFEFPGHGVGVYTTEMPMHTSHHTTFHVDN